MPSRHLAFASLAVLAALLAASPGAALPPPDLLAEAPEGVGVGRAVDERQGTHTLTIALFDETATQGNWSLVYGYTQDPHSIPFEFLSASRATFFRGNVEATGDFDPATGGCFTGAASELCMDFASRDALTGIVTYDVTTWMEVFRVGNPPLQVTYTGWVSVAFTDCLLP